MGKTPNVVMLLPLKDDVCNNANIDLLLQNSVQQQNMKSGEIPSNQGVPPSLEVISLEILNLAYTIM